MHLFHYTQDMCVRRRYVAVMLVTAVLTATVIPCTGSDAATNSHAHSHHEDTPRAAHGSPGGHAAPETGSSAILDAPCPCGCDERETAAGGTARLGAALLATPPSLEYQPLEVLITIARAASPATPLQPIDHVPRR